MDTDASVQTDDWKNTKESVAKFRRLLLCSKCSNLMKEPVCLGLCEHMLCRSCAGPRAGDGCAVCRSPAWVKDIQINRQLNTIVELFGGLDSLLNPVMQPESSVDDIQPQAESPVLKQRKNFKIWFSPRSRKVRCTVEKPSDVTVADGTSPGETAAAQQVAQTAQNQDLSVFNFVSSSQDSGSSSPQRRSGKANAKRSTKKNASNRSVAATGAKTTTRKRTKRNNKNQRLKAINEQWGIAQQVHDTSEKKQDCSEGARRSSKRVSFLNPDEPQPKMPQRSTNELSPARGTMAASVSECSIGVLNGQAQSNHSVSSSVAQQSKLPANDPSPKESPKKRGNASPSEGSTKRSRQHSPLETTPKRPRASPGRRRKSLGRMSPTVLHPRPAVSPTGGSPSALTAVSTESHRKSPGTPRASAGRPGTGSPAVMRRNHKGETPLHLAAIKGDVEAVKELLEQGADPNLRDNAGWTPLHEACNLGHVAVVEILASKGALLNTPGYENDSPLHDAVRNGHPAIVKLLLQLGAAQNVLNLHGKRPADYAASLEMRQIFQEVSEGAQYANAHTSPSPSASLSAVSDSARKDQTTVLLATKLSAPEQHQLVKLGLLLGGRMADTFSGSVSHVVVPEGQMPTTNSTLQGILAGCWIVRYSCVSPYNVKLVWKIAGKLISENGTIISYQSGVEACLQAGEWVPEAEHEAGEGPQRSRINRCSLLPPLFDGCFFFLLGSFKAPTKDELIKLLREGGGQLLCRQPKPDSDVTQTLRAAAYHALPGSDQALCTQYIIFDPQGPHRPRVERRGKVWSAPFTWLMNCIAAFTLLPVPGPQMLV